MSSTLKEAPVPIANWFINNAKNAGRPITHMQAQKLAYLTHGYWLQTHDDPLLTENPEVWPYGPVFPSIWRVLRGSKNNQINQPASHDGFNEPVIYLQFGGCDGRS